MTRGLLISLLALVCGCETFHHHYIPVRTVSHRTRNKYTLKDCTVYEYSQYKTEHHRGVMDIWGFKESELRAVEKLNPDLYSANGIPVSVKLCRDMDRFDILNPFLGLTDTLLALGTVGIVPLFVNKDEYVEVELLIDNGKGRSPRIGVNGSSRSVMSTLGLNLLFPYDESANSKFSCSGKAWVGLSDERHSFQVEKRCRIAGFADAIATALTEYEKSTSPAPSPQSVFQVPL